MKHILLDWDGVVRAQYYELASDTAQQVAAERARYVRHHVDLPEIDVVGHLLMVDPEVVARLNAIASLPDVTIFWFSATGHLTRKYFGPTVGLNDFRNAPFASDSPGQAGYPMNGFASLLWWKSVAVIEHLQNTAADVLWVDDSIYPDLQHHLRIQECSTTLSWVAPDFRVGLNRDELDAIERWARDGEMVRRDYRKR